jgi:deazaflavin-dependent oxidoreductase (nitroreductase family)
MNNRSTALSSSEDQRPSPASQSEQLPIGPSLMVRIVMGPMTKVLNPLVRILAGRRHFKMAARLHHRGRRSGRPYVTPIGARTKNGIIVIPLTFGNQSDWVRNVRAAGACDIRILGQTYHATNPVVVDLADAKAETRALFPVARLSFPLLGIRQVLELAAGLPEA